MIDFFYNAYKNASSIQIFLEFVAFVFGILSVWFAKKENILVYPTGLVATIITTYLLFKAGYLGDMIINFYFSIMSIYGWYNWSKTITSENIFPISRTSKKQKIIGLIMFLFTIVIVFYVYIYFDYTIKTENYFDILATGIFFTGMWYMALKKIENWIFWIVGNLIVIPLYAYRELGILALQYVIFTILAVTAYIEWRKILKQKIV